MRAFVAACCVALLVSSVAKAERIKVGEACPNFTNLETADGKKVSLSDFKQDALVIAITCNHCPVAVANEDRLIEFAKEYCGKDGKVALVAINVNNGEGDKLPAMAERVKEKGFNFPYAHDPSQKIAKDLGARKTPEFFVFDKNRKLVYTGKFDDSVMDASKVKAHYVVEAVNAVIEGKEPPKCNNPEGCGVRFE
ncbi:MAG: thioredoxin family protein [Planctomycetota bacterium]